MLYVLLGIAGFLVLYPFDLFSIKKVPLLKQTVGLLGAASIGSAHLGAATQGERLPLPDGVAFIGWPLFVLASLGIIYSLFLEIPFRSTYLEQGAGDRLVTSGTYALVRHPGVLWYAGILAGLVLLSRRWLMLLAAPVWLLMDVLYVLIQDRCFFPRMFPEYEAYRRHTPMLLPNRDSIRRCLKTLKNGDG